MHRGNRISYLPAERSRSTGSSSLPCDSPSISCEGNLRALRQSCAPVAPLRWAVPEVKKLHPDWNCQGFNFRLQIGISMSSTGERTPVVLNIYDLSPQNKYTYQCGLGIFHSGVEVYGVEYAFGGEFAALPPLARVQRISDTVVPRSVIHARLIYH